MRHHGTIRCPLVSVQLHGQTDPAPEEGKHSISQYPQRVKATFLEMTGSYKCYVFRSQEEPLQSLEIANIHPEKPFKVLQLSSQHL